ncbi:hypothetical protein EHQ96_10945 [Leptospira levettii]|uniref:Uncharacterized protein n=3 Tax=Leptospira TaxID=171 RepID=A0A2P2DD87_9LEPT|nr:MULTISPECIES: hypothetical protein [Leptospira]MCW7461828.1 hypothetical protein [Leptospira limi]MCW7464617.1 hypothetical protein [Leptospira levettii]MCW7473460.1 hypothetical protein [Leptospira levettii]MCW7511199.1 hypothetical protein [Leptospira levettii]MCW7514953.1 hypothetical protein [Leptospira levettii]
MPEEKKSSVDEVLKREKLAKDFEKEKRVSEQKAIEQAASKLSSQSQVVTETSKSSKFITNIDIAFSQAKSDLRYYFLNDGNYADEFKRMFVENEAIFKRYGITSQKYMEYIRESFDRYKKIHDMMPLDPMKPKHFKYVEDSISELIRMFNQRFGK